MPTTATPPVAWTGGGGYSYDEPDPLAYLPLVSSTVTDPHAAVYQRFGEEAPPGQGDGLVVGRFLPPHRGHQHLVNFARAWCAGLTLVCRVQPTDPIPGAVREAWLRELFPDVRVLLLADQGTLEPAALARALRQELSLKPAWLFASEPDGRDLAERLGAIYVPVDPLRQAVPISGTLIRQDPLAQWAYLPPCVRPHYVKRVAIMGPPGAGKSTLARALADHFQTVHVPEFARTGLQGQATLYAAQAQPVARGQLAAEAALARQAHRVLVLDNDLLGWAIWCRALLGDVPGWVEAEAARRVPDLTLVLNPGPWEKALPPHGRPYAVLPAEPLPQRLERAIAAVEGVLRAGDAGHGLAPELGGFT